VRQALIAFVASLLVIEVGLQLASLVARPLLARKSAGDVSRDAITLLCVGDSHTYGARLPDEESYPSQLKVLLAERYPEWEFNVVNLGFSGVNSAFVANRLESRILQIRPQLAMVSAGANNIWNSLEAEAWATETRWDAVKRMLMRLKLFRLAAITSSTQTKYHFEPEEEEGSRWHHENPEGRPIPHVSLLPVYGITYKKRKREEELRGDGLAHSIVFDMERIAALTQSYHIPVIWYNCPWPRHFPRVLQTIANTGARLGMPVLQAEKDYARALADGHTLRTLGNSRGVGLHPSGILYGYIVESMVPLVEEALREWHGIDLSQGPEGGTPTPGG
jgi:lysophospholipase L1-like esterase